MLDDRRRTIDMAALEQLLKRFFGRQYQLMCSHRVCVGYTDMSIVLTRLSTAQAALNPVLDPKGRQRKREEEIDLTLVCHCPIRNGLWLCEEDGDYVQALIAKESYFARIRTPLSARGCRSRRSTFPPAARTCTCRRTGSSRCSTLVPQSSPHISKKKWNP